MDPINPLDGLAELLRKRMAAEATARPAGRKAEAAPSDTPAAARPSVAVLKARLAEAIAAIEPTDPQRRRKVARLFAGGVLGWQFGEEIANDPRYGELLDEVAGALEAVPGAVERLMETD